ncbi:MAG: AbrB/MazE/SpoVT family DNA-binding domain-containing protein [Candidatus Yanofskybacteria bacterium]|nr:AbrB/MazE/SpoVT family DNA-binding domain-containing protein [Candidatus Yanofskybacteria bacterium]
MTQKVIKIGKSTGITIPKEILEKMRLRAGDRVAVEYDARRGSLMMKTTKKISARQKRIAELTQNFIERYRKDLEELAKK